MTAETYIACLIVAAFLAWMADRLTQSFGISLWRLLWRGVLWTLAIVAGIAFLIYVHVQLSQITDTKWLAIAIVFLAGSIIAAAGQR